MVITKVIIAGSREFTDYALLEKKCDKILKDIPKDKLIIVSGKCSGADLLGEHYAKSRGIPIEEFPADWNKHGKAAGPIRNKQMAYYASHLIVFWNGNDKGGSINMIKQAREQGLTIRIIEYLKYER